MENHVRNCYCSRRIYRDLATSECGLRDKNIDHTKTTKRRIASYKVI